MNTFWNGQFRFHMLINISEKAQVIFIFYILMRNNKVD